jgi:hypothetical protein
MEYIQAKMRMTRKSLTTFACGGYSRLGIHPYIIKKIGKYLLRDEHITYTIQPTTPVTLTVTLGNAKGVLPFPYVVNGNEYTSHLITPDWWYTKEFGRCTCVVGTCLYLVGKINKYGYGQSTGSEIHKYNPHTNTWAVVGKLQRERYSPMVICMQVQKFHTGDSCLGGKKHSSDSPWESHLVQTHPLDIFTPITKLPMGVSAPDRSGKNREYRWDLMMKEHTRIPKHPLDVLETSVYPKGIHQKKGNQLVIVGGFLSQIPDITTEIFDCDSNTSTMIQAPSANPFGIQQFPSMVGCSPCGVKGVGDMVVVVVENGTEVYIARLDVAKGMWVPPVIPIIPPYPAIRKNEVRFDGNEVRIYRIMRGDKSMKRWNRMYEWWKHHPYDASPPYEIIVWDCNQWKEIPVQITDTKYFF